MECGVQQIKDRICEYIDEITGELSVISRRIFEHPELKFEEFAASRLLATRLEQAGFETERGVAGLETAIRAVHPVKSSGPTVALVAEYDALPTIGHACGHNLIATGALGAVLGLAEAKTCLPGTLVFLGTPAEEGGGGKIVMLEAGAFDGIDVAMMFHPHRQTVAGRPNLAISEVKIEFFGKASHASSAPERGKNALDGVIQTFIGINAMRQHIQDSARIHGIITNGGQKPNIVPEHAACLFNVRAPKSSYRNELVRKLCLCAEGAATATGTRHTCEVVGRSYNAGRRNLALESAFASNLTTLGENVQSEWIGGIGSTDMGNVSEVIPSLHAYVAICGQNEATPHTREFAKAAASKRGEVATMKAAKALALTAVDIFLNNHLIEAVKGEFHNKQVEAKKETCD